jgi:hypothetical protein
MFSLTETKKSYNGFDEIVFYHRRTLYDRRARTILKSASKQKGEASYAV